MTNFSAAYVIGSTCGSIFDTDFSTGTLFATTGLSSELPIVFFTLTGPYYFWPVNSVILCHIKQNDSKKTKTGEEIYKFGD